MTTANNPALAGSMTPASAAPPVAPPQFAKKGDGDGAPPAAPPAFAKPPAGPPAPRTYATVALVLALFSALVLAEQPAGIGLAFVGVALTTATLTLRQPRDRFATACLVGAGILSAVPAVRDSMWVAALSVVGAITLASVALAGARTWRETAVGLVMWIGQLIPAPVLMFADATRRVSGRRWSQAGPAIRGTLLATVLVVLFGGLFASADAHFADILRGLTSWDLNAWSLTVRATVFGLVLTLAGALWLVAATRQERPAREAKRRLGRTEWLITLAALVLLFAAFVATQLPALFGGDARVQHTDGLTYAFNARQGFVQLMIVAALTLVVVMGSVHHGPKGDLFVRLGNGALCLLTIVVLASAVHRLGLYVDAYGATRLRFSAAASMFWLGGVLILIVLTGAVGRTRVLPRALIALSALFAIGTVAVNPDANIATRNVERYLDTGRLDSSYLTTLSVDAVPAIHDLPPRLRSCIAGFLSEQIPQPDGVVSQNIGRARARHTLRSLAPDTTRLGEGCARLE